jgi:predicted dehydrogenase
VTARIANNVLASCVFSERTSANDEVEILGSAGRLRISLYRFDGTEYFPAGSLPGDARTRARQLVQTIKELPGGLLRARQGGDFIASYRAMWRHFADCIRRGTKPECTIEDGKKALRAVLAAMASARRAESGSSERRRSMPSIEAE